MNLDVKIKTRINNKKKIITIKYTKKPCHLYNKYMCEILSVTDEIDRKSASKTHWDITGNKSFLQRHEINRYCLYIPENPIEENKLLIENHSQNYKKIDSIFYFLLNVFFFLLDARIKGGIKGLEQLLFQVSDLLMKEVDRRYESQNIW